MKKKIMFLLCVWILFSPLKASSSEGLDILGQKIADLFDFIAMKETHAAVSRKGFVYRATGKESHQELEKSFRASDYPSVVLTATGYTAGYESTGKTEGDPDYGITYSGLPVKRDLYSTIAADLTQFPLGTILFVPGYGYGVVADIGGAVKGNHIDLYFETVADVYAQWGKRELEVYIVKLGDGEITEAEFHQLNENEAVQVFRSIE